MATAATGAAPKGLKRKQSEEAPMEVETHNNIEGTAPGHKARPRKMKKVYSTEELRRIPIPAHRYTPLRENWRALFNPVTEYLQLQMKANLKTRTVDIRVCEATKDIGNLQKAADFVKAFMMGFEVDDAMALLRLNDLFVETFEIKDVKTLKGDHQSRAIGRLAGKGGQTKHTIENVTKTRIVLADTRIHILGSFQNIQIARRAICNLIVGAPPSKVYGKLRGIAHGISEQM